MNDHLCSSLYLASMGFDIWQAAAACILHPSGSANYAVWHDSLCVVSLLLQLLPLLPGASLVASRCLRGALADDTRQSHCRAGHHTSTHTARQVDRQLQGKCLAKQPVNALEWFQISRQRLTLSYAPFRYHNMLGSS